MGDIGVAVAEEHLKDLEGQVHDLLALAGAHATIALDQIVSGRSTGTEAISVPSDF